MRINDAVNLYIDRISNVEMLSPVTVKNRKSSLTYMARWMEKRGYTRLSCMTLQNVREFFTEYTQTGEKSRNTIATMQNHVRLFFKYLQEYEELVIGFNSNLVKAISFVSVRKETIPREVLYLALADMEDEQMKLMTLLLFTTGMRVSELVRLKLNDIDGEYIHVIGKGRHGGKLRIVYAPEFLVEELIKFARKHRRNDGYLFRRREEHSNVDIDSHLHTDTVRTWLRPYFKRYSYDFTPHVARHTFAQDLLKSGADVRAIQECLGHSSLTTTTKYLQVPSSHIKEVYDRCMTIKPKHKVA